jgi:hypothetical protein
MFPEDRRGDQKICPQTTLLEPIEEAVHLFIDNTHVLGCVLCPERFPGHRSQILLALTTTMHCMVQGYFQKPRESSVQCSCGSTKCQIQDVATKGPTAPSEALCEGHTHS